MVSDWNFSWVIFITHRYVLLHPIAFRRFICHWYTLISFICSGGLNRYIIALVAVLYWSVDSCGIVTILHGSVDSWNIISILHGSVDSWNIITILNGGINLSILKFLNWAIYLLNSIGFLNWNINVIIQFLLILHWLIDMGCSHLNGLVYPLHEVSLSWSINPMQIISKVWCIVLESLRHFWQIYSLLFLVTKDHITCLNWYFLILWLIILLMLWRICFCSYIGFFINHVQSLYWNLFITLLDDICKTIVREDLVIRVRWVIIKLKSLLAC